MSAGGLDKKACSRNIECTASFPSSFAAIKMQKEPFLYDISCYNSPDLSYVNRIYTTYKTVNEWENHPDA